MDPRERRSSPRQPIKLAAQIDVGSGESLPCQIADFCAEGLYIRYSGQTSAKLDRAFERSELTEVVVRFRGLDSNVHHELHVRPARRIERAMGGSFLRANPAAIEALIRLCGSGNNQSRSSLQAPSDRVQFVLHQCARVITQFIEPLMDACFVNTVSALKTAAQNASSDQSANEYMDASGQVEARQRVLWHHMARSLESPLKPEPKGAPGALLSVVDKNEFEDWLAVKVMVTRADTLYRGDLLELKLRLDNLGISNQTGHHNPLGPALVCEAFHHALVQLKVSRDVEKVCLKVFEQTVIRQLAPLYRELNNILIRHGVLPDLDLTKYLSEQAAERVTPKPSPPKENNEAPKPSQKETEDKAESRVSGEFRGYSRHAQTAFATVRNLLSSLKLSRSASAEPASESFDPDARPLSNSELSQELQELQLQAADLNVPDVPLKERVVAKVKNSIDNARLNEDSEGALDVVDRFFRSVTESPKLSGYAQDKMRQLQVPVLKVVMRDPSFFEDQSSPVRSLMNRLAQISMKGARPNPIVQRKVDELVQRIATDFDQDTVIFDEAVEELDTLIERQNLAYRRNVERVTAAAQGSQKVADSKAAVAAALDEKLAGRKVPKAVVSLLDGGWRDLLSLTWIRQGDEGQLWQDYLAVIDSLMAYAESPGNSSNLPELLRLIQDGLASISSNRTPSSQIRDELKQLMVRQPGEPLEWVDMPKSQSEQPAKPAADEREMKSLQRWINRAQQLQTGDWFKDQSKPDEPHYIRLVWVADNFSRFVFVNHQGMRVVELAVAALARKMRDGDIILDSQYEKPLVDESIDRMVRNVYDQLSWVSTHDDLTHLLNRREFERMLEQQLADRKSTRTLLHLDLKGFRLLSDVAGQKSADETLKQVADILGKHADESVPVSRIEGTEFAMLVPDDQAEAVAKSLVSAIAAEDYRFGGKVYELTANVGIVPTVPAVTSAERWLRTSEQVLSVARRGGTGYISVYSQDDEDQARQDQIAARVANLGDPTDERMLLRCQKIIPLHSEARMSAQYEILISMYDDSGELVTGRDLVRMAERYDRMQAVDRWVVGHMLDWLRDKKPDARDVGGICINLSGYSLNEQALLEFIYEKLSEKDAPIERLWFELTEASAIHDVQAVARFIEETKELGCRFCLGNFGTGPNSYEFMRSLPIDLIKIDSAFTRQLATNATDQAMVKSMVDMAHFMEREVVATQVETREVLDKLTQLGVDYAQGFVIEKPKLLNSLI
ncbi:DUF1631 family protein [Marinobacter sp.]|uniref:DUF1631 family protein n=1 Tax=Marinobacter sp. TaxID=50741 RepID=UPI002B266FED|nr:DUF1631 family protein [Marinobacter sp.]